MINTFDNIEIKSLIFKLIEEVESLERIQSEF